MTQVNAPHRSQARRRVRSAPQERPVVALPDEFRSQVEKIALEAVEAVMTCFPENRLPTTASEFKKLEESLQVAVGIHVIGAILALVIRLLHLHKPFVLWSLGAAKNQCSLKTNQDRKVSVRVAGGATFEFETPYMTPVKEPRPGPKVKRGRRGPGGAGLYPILATLGFVSRVSPYVASTAARTAAQLDSYEEATEALAAIGLTMDINTVRNIAQRVGDAGLKARELNRGGNPTTLAGKRVVASFDGGRLRYRIDKPGRPRKSGHHGFSAPWREPKIMVIYTVDAEGKKTNERPIYEGTLAPWDDAFEIFTAVLTRYGAKDADVLLLSADGSDSIWDRKDELIKRLGIDPAKVRECLDFYHGVEHLYDAIRLCPDRSDRSREQWVKKQAKRLKKGRTHEVIAALKRLVATDKEALEKEIEFFRSRVHLTKYDELKAEGLPIGTGSVESGIRRIVNLRLKGTGVFWTPENAERILFLRCRLKAGRWDEVEEALYDSALKPASQSQPEIFKRLVA